MHNQHTSLIQCIHNFISKFRADSLFYVLLSNLKGKMTMFDIYINLDRHPEEPGKRRNSYTYICIPTFSGLNSFRIDDVSIESHLLFPGQLFILTSFSWPSGSGCLDKQLENNFRLKRGEIWNKKNVQQSENGAKNLFQFLLFFASFIVWSFLNV